MFRFRCFWPQALALLLWRFRFVSQLTCRCGGLDLLPVRLHIYSFMLVHELCDFLTDCQRCWWSLFCILRSLAMLYELIYILWLLRHFCYSLFDFLTTDADWVPVFCAISIIFISFREPKKLFLFFSSSIRLDRPQSRITIQASPFQRRILRRGHPVNATILRVLTALLDRRCHIRGLISVYHAIEC